MAERIGDDGVVGRAATRTGGTADGLSYAVPRAPRRHPRLVLPAVALGAGVALGTGALLVLQLA